MPYNDALFVKDDSIPDNLPRKAAFLLLFVAGAFAIGLYGAFVITQLWLWFFVPAGLPAITLKSAIGLVLITRALTWRLGFPQTDTKLTPGRKDLINFLTPAAFFSIAWLCGWVWFHIL